MKKHVFMIGTALLAFSALAGCTQTVENKAKTEVEEAVKTEVSDKLAEKKVVAYEDRKIYQFDPEKQVLVDDGVIKKGEEYLRPVKTGETLLQDDEYYDYVQYGDKMVLINAMESTTDLRETMAKE